MTQPTLILATPALIGINPVPCKALQAALVAVQGRCGGTIDPSTGLGKLPLLLSWPASSLYLTFTGDSINGTLTAMPPAVTSSAQNRLVFYINDRQVAIRSTSPDDLVIRWSMAGLGSGTGCLLLLPRL